MKFLNRNPEQEMMRSQQDFDREQMVMGMAGGMAEAEAEAPQPDKSDLIIWQQNLDPELQQLIHDLRNEYMDDNGEWIQEHRYKGRDKHGNAIWEPSPILNERGIQVIISMLRPLTGRNLMMSNYSETRILISLSRNLKTLVAHLAYNRELYELKKGDMSQVVELYKRVAEPAHWRCWNNGERRYLTHTSKRVEAVSDNPQHKPKSFLGMFTQGG